VKWSLAALVACSALVATEARADDAAPDDGPVTSRRSVKLFDARYNYNAFSLELGPVWSKKATGASLEEKLAGFQHGTGEIALGSTQTTKTAPFFLVGQQRTLLRILDSKSFSWSIFQQQLGGGLRLGPLEATAFMGLGVLTADVFHAEWSVQLLTPRVGAGIGLRLGKLLVDMKANSEYLWRWFGEDYFVRSVTLGLEYDLPPAKSPFAEK